MPFEKIWIEQCRATRAIKRRFGAKDALDYLVGEKLRMFAEAARHYVAFARELPRFLYPVSPLCSFDLLPNCLPLGEPGNRGRRGASQH
jgi:hypothetical protein